MIRTDNEALVGVHAFEDRGLGKAPFRVTGFSESIYQASPDSPRQPGSNCDYCGTGIMIVCHIQSADGHHFKVGCNCVEKTGDKGLIRAYKSTPEYRQMQAQKRAAKDKAIGAQWDALIAANSEQLRAIERETWNGGTEPLLDYYLRVWPMCGASGRAAYLKVAKSKLGIA